MAVPHCLAVVVGVDVHEARCDQLPLGVDLLGAVTRNLADGGDAIALDADIGLDGRASGAVNDGSAAYDQVEFCCHRTSPFRFASIVRRQARFVTTPSPARQGGWEGDPSRRERSANRVAARIDRRRRR